MRKLMAIASALLLSATAAHATTYHYDITASNNGDASGPPVPGPIAVWLGSYGTDCQANYSQCTGVGTIIQSGESGVEFVAPYDIPTGGNTHVSVWVQEDDYVFYRCTDGYPTEIVPGGKIVITAHLNGCLGSFSN